jgi:hypothetical protein
MHAPGLALAHPVLRGEMPHRDANDSRQTIGAQLAEAKPKRSTGQILAHRNALFRAQHAANPARIGRKIR